MTFEYKLGGRKVSGKRFFEELGDQAIKQAEDHLELKLKDLRDPETGVPANVTRVIKNGQTTWSVKGSPAVVEAAKRLMSGES